LYEQTAALPAEKMLWYRKQYLPDELDWAHPEASPLFYQGNWSQLPRALILVAELDVFRAEGEEYAEKLRAAGVPVDLHVMLGMPHPFLAMNGMLEQARKAISLICDTLSRAFWNK
jgi:triacylglycerol lipase